MPTLPIYPLPSSPFPGSRHPQAAQTSISPQAALTKIYTQSIAQQ